MASDLVEAERLRFEGDLDKWMKLIGAGISGYQPEAYAVMDAACAELATLRTALAEQSRLNAEKEAEAYRRGVEDERRQRCANCGSTGGRLISIGEGETVCSVKCEDEHERLGCPFETGSAYRQPVTARGLMKVSKPTDLVERLRELSKLIGNAWNSKATIIAAADEIAGKRARISELTTLLDQHMGTPCQQIRHIQTEKTLVDALKPFATYMTPGMDCDDRGAPLPDDHGVGWVYLTMGDFRRAAAAIRSLPADKEGA